jgi:hypothetical protein
MCSEHPNPEDLKSERSRLDTVISLVQPLSIIIGGCWIAFLYFTYQEKSDIASLTEKQLSIQQAQILLKTQEQSNKLDVDLKRISLDQARVALETQQGQKELTKTQLATEVELKKQEVLLNRLKEKQQEQEVRYSTSYRSSYEMTLKAIKVRESSKGLNDYRVSLLFALRNESTVNYEVSFIAVEYYVGVPKQELGEAQLGVGFAPVGTPPSLVNSEAQTGALEWSSLGPPNASFWGPAHGSMGMWDYLVTPSTKFNGPNTGAVVPGGRTQFAYDYIVRARPGTYLGFVVDWIINRANGGSDDVNYVNRIVQLPEDNAEVVVQR